MDGRQYRRLDGLDQLSHPRARREPIWGARLQPTSHGFVFEYQQRLKMIFMFAGIKGRDCGPRSGPENSGHAPRGISEGPVGGETRSVSAVRHKEDARLVRGMATDGEILGR